VERFVRFVLQRCGRSGAWRAPPRPRRGHGTGIVRLPRWARWPVTHRVHRGSPATRSGLSVRDRRGEPEQRL